MQNFALYRGPRSVALDGGKKNNPKYPGWDPGHTDDIRLALMRKEGFSKHADWNARRHAIEFGEVRNAANGQMTS